MQQSTSGTEFRYLKVIQIHALKPTMPQSLMNSLVPSESMKSASSLRPKMDVKLVPWSVRSSQEKVPRRKITQDIKQYSGPFIDHEKRCLGTLGHICFLPEYI